MQDGNNKFNFTYSAPTESERREIESIRRQYIKDEKVETPEETIRRLHARVVNGATVASLVLGIVGILAFGFGLTCFLEWNEILAGIVASVIGAAITALAYPVYKSALARGKRRYGKTILSLSEKVLGEKK